MRQGFYAQLVLSKSGNLVAVATGSDACAEHEIGIKPLLSAMTEHVDKEASIVKQLKGVFRALVTYPEVIESKRVTKLPEQYQFIVTDTADGPEAWLGVASQPLTTYAHELPLTRISSRADQNVAGAYDDKSFAIRVRGEKYVKALRQFDAAMRAGDVLFAGTFFERPKLHLGGIILANRKFIGDEDKERIDEAQRKFESGLRLKARDDSRELMQEMRALSGQSDYNYVWAVWADDTESSVVYGLNPGSSTPADYGIGYTREELIRWAKAKYSYHLRRQRMAA